MQLLANSLLDLTFDDFQILVGFDQARPLQVRVNSLNVGVGFIRYASVHPRWHADFKEQQIASCQRRIVRAFSFPSTAGYHNELKAPL
jgi:hypothetical protein